MAKKSIKTSLKSFWHQPSSYFGSVVVFVIAAYILGSLAIDSGRILEWTLAIVFIIWAIARLIGGIRLVIVNHGKR